MIRNYLKIALRNLVKNKAYSFINIGGLAVGMAVAMLIGLWVWDELSFNKNHENYETIAKVVEHESEKGKRYANDALPLPLTYELKSNFNDYFKHILIAFQPEEYILTTGQTKLTKKGQFIESDAPDMLSLRMLKGTRAGLKDLNSVLLSASAANDLFGDKDPVNQIVKINKNISAKVTGVYEDLPHNSEFYSIKFFAPFDLLTSANPWIKEQKWDNWFLLTYVQVKPNFSMEKVSKQIKDIEINKIKQLEGMEEQIARNPQIALLPMSDWHLYGNYDRDDNEAIKTVWLFGFIGFAILLLACINFMNLSTARSEKRAKEVGIRKAVGSLQKQLIFQFYLESFLIVFMAFAFSILLVNLSLNWFNDIAEKQLSFPFNNIYYWISCTGFVLFTGILAGSYPALYLSAFQPIKVLKGVSVRVGRWASIPRKLLIVSQFTVSVTLIIGTVIIYKQIQHAKNRPIGYSKNGLLMIEKKTEDFNINNELLKTELKNTGMVSEVAQSRSAVTGITMWNGGFFNEGKEIDCPNGCGTLPISAEYGKTVGWQFVGGEDFSRASDSTGIILNESFVKLAGLKNPVGKTLIWDPKWRKPKAYNVLGVIKDMVSLSPFEPTIPTVYFIEDNYSWINLRINPNVSVSEALPKIEAVFRKLIPSAPFDYKFADTEFATKFAAEERTSKLVGIFAILAIFISCLGLFGLASFIAEQRTKEIGIRKVLGASVANLWQLLSKDFVVLVIISCLIAIPIAYYFMNEWLQKYTYRTEISWWIFVAAGVGALLVTLLTVSFQAIKAALMNPVKSLKTE
jgi:putative ABC transport system permease protein